jgi:hypothetical protein
VFLADVGEFEPAVELLQEAGELFRAQEPSDAAPLGRVEYVLGRCLWRRGEPEPAREHLLEAARLLDASPSATNDERARVQRDLQALERSVGR